MAGFFTIAFLLSSCLAARALPSRQSRLSVDGPAGQDQASEYLPLLVWHGLGDTYDSDGMAAVGELLNKTIGPTYTYYIRVDDDSGGDRTATWWGNVTTEIEKVCQDLAAHPILSRAPAVNAIGFSQGGQFLRAYVERCNSPPVANLITFGSQHNGISEFQACKPDELLCNTWENFLKHFPWTEFAQSTLVPAQYYRDPEDYDNYLEYSNFLADVNNERELKNETYKENLKKLEKFVMYMFEDDTTVVPKESSLFAEVNTNTDKVIKLQDRVIYKEDWLGLKWLDEQGRLEFKVTPGQHMQIDAEVLNHVFKEYLTGTVAGRGKPNVEL